MPARMGTAARQKAAIACIGHTQGLQAIFSIECEEWFPWKKRPFEAFWGRLRPI